MDPVPEGLKLILNSLYLFIHIHSHTHWDRQSLCQQSLTHMEVFVTGSPECVCVAAGEENSSLIGCCDVESQIK